MSTLFVFLLLAGGTAIAAKKLGKNTVGPKQLKANAVTTKKIKKNSVTRAKLRAGAVDGSKLAAASVSGDKIADGAVSGAKIDTGSTVFGRRVARLQHPDLVPITGSAPFPIGSFLQRAGEANQYLAAMDVRFDAGCEAPRDATVLLLIDALNPAIPLPGDYAGYALVQDTGVGTVTRRVEFATFPGLGGSLARTAPAADTTRKFDFLLSSSTCKSGGGVFLTNGIVDVIGTR